MNTIGHEGAKTPDGMTAQLMLLKDTPPTRPVRLALAILRKETAVIPAVAASKSRRTAAAAAERDYRK